VIGVHKLQENTPLQVTRAAHLTLTYPPHATYTHTHTLHTHTHTAWARGGACSTDARVSRVCWVFLFFALFMQAGRIHVWVIN
jgi:hypothetical protein